MGLTKEQKKAKKEAKRLEKLKAQLEARKKLKRIELQREIAAQARQRGELDKSWKEMMLKIKEPIFRKDIEVMWHTFERVYDRKKCLVNHIMKLIKLADDQFQRTVSSFCDSIDTMNVNFLTGIEKLSEENDRRTANTLKLGEINAAQIKKDHNAAETHLQLLLYHGHTTTDSLAWTTRGENLVKEDEERNKYTNDREFIRSLLENSYNNMWDEYKAVLKAYIAKTSGNQKEVRKLRVKENLMADIIASQSKKIANSDSVLKKLRSELSAYESGTKQAVFRDRRDRHRVACFRLKQKLINGCATDEKQLATLVRDADSAVEWLRAAHQKGEKILRMAALCRKFETQREKVLPFGSTLPQSTVEPNSNIRQQPENSLVANAISSTSGLTRLWQKIADAELTRRALSREKMLLEQENEMIISEIQNDSKVKLEPGSRKCICVNTQKKENVQKPVAIDGVLEVSKYGIR